MEILLLLLLILLNGAFSMSEIAVVSSRRARLQRMVDDRVPGATTAAALQEEPAAFLSTVQIGITSIAVLSGALGEGMIARPLAEWLATFPLFEANARVLSVVLVVASIAYLSVVIGELVPKRLALMAPERIASLIARPMAGLSRIARPLVWLLSSSSSLVLGAVGAGRSVEPPVTDEEIKVLMEQGSVAGVFHESEHAIVSNVLRLDEQRLGAIMTPRMDIFSIDLDDDPDEIRQQVEQSPHSRIVVCRGGIDRIVGMLRPGDLLKPALSGQRLDIESVLKPAYFVPETITVTQLLESFRRERLRFALVVDEYGELQGLVSLTDVLTTIVGELPASELPGDEEVVQRADGSWLIDGSISIDRLLTVLDVDELDEEEGARFHTLGGFAMHRLGRIPAVADYFDAAGYRFEIVDMDRNRVDKLLVCRVPGDGTQPGPSAPPAV
jgi:putative hemolysin